MCFFNKKIYIFCFFNILFYLNIKLSVCPVERDYINKRQEFILKTSSNLSNIGICFSGGSNRAVISCSGFLAAAKEIGLLDKTLYLSSLSGSTWLMIYILAHLNCDSSYEQIKNFQERIKENLSHELIDFNIFEQNLDKRIIDLWGALISNQIFGPESNLISQKFSFLLPRNPASWPFPIFNAAIKFVKDNNCCCFCNCCCYDQKILEVNPCCTGVNNIISTNNFEKLLESNTGKQTNLDFFVGLFGTAYNFDFGALKNLVRQNGSEKALERHPSRDFILQTLNSGTFLPTLIPNFDKSLSDSKNLIVRDAGFISNLPLISLLKRNLNIIFICDASDNSVDLNYQELRVTYNYAKKINFPFPYIDNPEIYKKHNPAGPEFLMYIFRGYTTLVYFPNRIKFSSTKFQYSHQEFDLVANYMQNCILAFSEEIRQLIIAV